MNPHEAAEPKRRPRMAEKGSAKAMALPRLDTRGSMADEALAKAQPQYWPPPEEGGGGGNE